MTTYSVLAKRWIDGWELHIGGVGVTQCRRLNNAERMVRDYLALDLGPRPAAAATIELTIETAAALDVATRAARQAVTEAERLQREAAALSRSVARDLKAAGLTGAEVATVLGVSPQRASQLLRG